MSPCVGVSGQDVGDDERANPCVGVSARGVVGVALEEISDEHVEIVRRHAHRDVLTAGQLDMDVVTLVVVTCEPCDHMLDEDTAIRGADDRVTHFQAVSGVDDDTSAGSVLVGVRICRNTIFAVPVIAAGSATVDCCTVASPVTESTWML